MHVAEEKDGFGFGLQLDGGIEPNMGLQLVEGEVAGWDFFLEVC